MKIGFIGAGKVACAFGKYLVENGFDVYGYYNRTYEKAQEAAKYTNSKAIAHMDKLVRSIDILFVTTGDDSISQVCNQLVEENLLSRGQIIVHMSGAASSNVLEEAKKNGCFIYSLHPLQAFADIEKAVKDLKGTVFSIEGDEEKFEVMEGLLKKLGNDYFKLTTEQKSIYHATACAVSNYLVTLMDYGVSLFASIGIDEKDGYKALYPLIEGTVKNIYNLGTVDALTGPIARGDLGTIQKHIDALKNNKKDDLDFYKFMGLKTVELAKKKGTIKREEGNNLKNILRGVD